MDLSLDFFKTENTVFLWVSNTAGLLFDQRWSTAGLDRRANWQYVTTQLHLIKHLGLLYIKNLWYSGTTADKSSKWNEVGFPEKEGLLSVQHWMRSINLKNSKLLFQNVFFSSPNKSDKNFKKHSVYIHSEPKFETPG